MINAIAGLSDLGASLQIAKAMLGRNGAAAVCADCGGVHAPGADHVGSIRPTDGSGASPDSTTTPTREVGETSAAQDTVEISPQAYDAARRAESDKASADGPAYVVDEQQLTDQERKQVDSLKKADAAVRAHEAAHKAAAGAYGGAVSYSFRTGPDGRRYAVAGEVPIDLSPIPGDPQATVLKMQQIRRAALAPAEPSGADRQVAAKAAQIEQQARAELVQSRSGSSSEDGENGSDTELSPAEDAAAAQQTGTTAPEGNDAASESTEPVPEPGEAPQALRVATSTPTAAARQSVAAMFEPAVAGARLDTYA